MIRIFLEEWRRGRAFSVRRALPVLAPVLLAGLLFLHALPGVFFEILALGFVAGGLASGTRLWNGEAGWAWVEVMEARPWAYAAAKVAGWAAVSLTWTVALLPPFLVLAQLWSLPWEPVAGALAWGLTAGAVAQVLGHLATWGPGTSGRILGPILVAVWIGATFQTDGWVPWNPLWQVADAFLETPAGSTVVPMAGLLGFCVVGWALLTLAWTVRKGHR